MNQVIDRALARWRSLALTMAMVASVVAGPLAGPSEASGGASLVVTQWGVDYGTGKVSYDLTLSVADAAAPGGPCAGYCDWRIEIWYRDGTQELNRGSVSAGSANHMDDFSIRRDSPGTMLPEATHIRAVVQPRYDSSRSTFTTSWREVSQPFPSGSVSVAVQDWRRDAASGAVEYDVTLSWRGAAQLGGPCVSYCKWRIEIWQRDDGTDEWRGGLGGATVYAQNTWSHSVRVTRAEPLPAVTYLRAVLEPAGRVAGETYESWRFVGEHMVEDRDLVPYEVALSTALAASPDRFCDVLAVAGGALPSVEPDSPPDAWKRCVEAVRLYGPNIRKVLAAVATAAGGAIAVEYLLDEHVNEGPTPSPQEEENPPLPWVPPASWEDNGCALVIPPESVDAKVVHVTSRHSWEAVGKVSRFYPWIDWQYLAKKDALRVPPVPSSKPEWLGVRCERTLDWKRDVGIDRYTGKPTRTYTVVTDRATGNLVTVHPGPP